MIGRLALIAAGSAILLAGCGVLDDEDSTRPKQLMPDMESKMADRVFIYDCGKTPVKAVYHGKEALTLYIGGKQEKLIPTEAASGARYATSTGPDAKTVFWSKGNEATLERAGSGSVSCRQIHTP